MTSLLITGATGAHGKRNNPRILGDPGACVTVLLRARDPEELARRREGLLSYLDWSNRQNPALGYGGKR